MSLRALFVFCLALPVLGGPLQPGQDVEQHPTPSDTGTSLHMTFPAPSIEVMAEGEVLRLGDEGMLGVAGCPDLPLVNRLVEVPATRNINLNVRQAHWVDLGVHEIRPLQERLHSELELPLDWIMNEDVYAANSLWPAEWINISDPVLVRDTRLVKLSIAPYRWNPVSGELQGLSSIDLSIEFSGRNEINVPTRTMEDEGLSDDDEGLVYSQNRMVAEASFTRALLGNDVIRLQANPDAGEVGELESLTWESSSLPLNYLVFARNAAQNQTAFQNWLNWKQRKGHHMTVLSESDLTFSSSSIRGRISSEYQNSEFPPHYVVLMGDTEGSYSIPTHNSQYDHYYSTVSGNDILADVVVGRISVETANEMATVLNKITSYESAPVQDPDWLQRASFLTGTGHCGVSMSQLSRSIGFQMILERGYTQIDTAFCASSPSYVYNWMNQGISFYNYRGWIGMEGLNRNTLMNMTNPKTPIAVVFTCSSGDFYSSWETAYSEAFLRGGNPSELGGAVASMGFCTPNTHTAHNNVVSGGFFSGMLDYNIPQVGTCMFRGKYDLYLTLPEGDSNASNFAYWANLMGDPGMDMWCGVPGSMQLEGVPSSIGAGSQSLNLRVVSGLSGVPGAAVCAWFDDERSVVAVSDESGYVQLHLPELEAGTLQLTVTKGFHYPVQTACAVDAAMAMPVIEAVAMTDADEDGYWTPGEELELVIDIRNLSDSEMLGALDVELIAHDQAVSVLAGTASLPELEAGGSGQLVGELRVLAPADWTDGIPVALSLLMTDGELEYSQLIHLDVDSPVIRIASGGLSEVFYPGDTATMQLRLQNAGNLAAENMDIEFMVAAETGFSIDPATLTVSLDPEQMTTVELELTADQTMVPGFTSQVIIDWNVADLANGRLRQSFTMGDQQPEDPTGPDAHGYYAFESHDSQWLQAPGYNWIEIAPAAGGNGEEVILHDNGDEQDDSRRVELPFPFTVYGQVYSSLAVCSNGFVAFGELAHLENDFRNHYMPCGMGPEPMLAPMWDDHKLTGDAQVCTSYIEESGVFVIEWYRMRTNSNNRINTFQLLLFDPALYATPTGDGEFVFQYHTFDDNQSNSQDFPYCTVGIKNHDATVGLNLLNYHLEDATVQSIDAGMAIRFTTSMGLTTDPAQLELPVAAVDLHLMHSEQEEQADSLEIRNLGEAPLVWQATVRPPLNWPALSGGSRDGGGPDSEGYTWIDSDEEAGPRVGWFDAGDEATPVTFESNDDNEGPFAIGFDVPFYGQLFSEFWINANGFIAFEDPQSGYYQNNIGGLPDDDAPDNALLVWWDDLLNDDTLSGITEYWSNGADSLVVSWVEAPHYNPSTFGGPFTFQVIVEGNGRITYNYGDMAEDDPDSDSGTVGLQVSEDLGFSVIDVQDQSRDNYSLWILPPFWLELESSTGLVPNGNSGWLRLQARNHVQGFQMPQGEYQAVIVMICNDPDQPVVEIPVTMTLNDLALAESARPESFEVSEAWPNPFNPSTMIDFRLPMQAPVEAVLYNMLGRKVNTLLRRELPAGSHQLVIDGARLASGVYLLQIHAGSEQAVRKLMLVK